MRKYIVFLIVLSFTALHALGQVELGAKVGVGLSQISGYFRGGNIKITPLPSPSAIVGCYAQFGIGSKLLIGTGLQLSQITDHYRLKLYFTDDLGNPLPDYSEGNVHRNITYLSVPLMLGMHVSKLCILGGLQGSFALRSGGRVNGHSPSMGDSYDFQTYYPRLGIDQIDWGPKVAVQWPLTKRLSMEGCFYQGLHKIVSFPSILPSWRVRQFLVELHWAFYKSEGR